ncbi:glycine betaine ABC transporter substrate-binding protein [Marivirga salinae]|uniref:Glycine betaine ABC transporter substrate-binding protein n=1 Tax=Marivirga salinarum TaxID=3059078 RepID=A0AA49GD67_9BACT|nr:glycine betaine ABC transporter substrate-binding protein [Marivirga sp. BDSF4-3]WKK74607.1 glycine betaine ABC transporter substrate-binding protein [Marivirga sp. BDSF4-3]
MSSFYDFLIKNKAEVFKQLIEHIELTLVSLCIAVLLGVTIGILIAIYQKTTKTVLSVVNVIQTVPSLALLGFLLPFFGIGVVPAIIALFLYALLPIVRNTYTGITEVDPAVKESAIAMGMKRSQVLFKGELPLALPYIMAGIRTASVINVGVATLSAFIAAGGLGKFILQGIQLNNTNMILAGAIPASLLALFFDAILGRVQKSSLKIIRWFSIVLFGGMLVYLMVSGFQKLNSSNVKNELIGGFPSEFIYREDGLKGLFKTYDFEMDYVEMEIGLLYQALANKEVDVISGFSTDGRIKAFNLKTLKDNRNYFPPYQAAPVARATILKQYPEISESLSKLENQISNSEMTEMNYKVDEGKMQPDEVAHGFLQSKGLLNKNKNKKGNAGTIKIGSKAFTENYILAHLFKMVIEENTHLNIEMKLGFGGTKLLMDAMKNDEIDIYPEYTGTALLLLLETNEKERDDLFSNPDKVYDFVNKESEKQFNFEWLPALGFNNTFAILTRKEQAEELGLNSIEDLADH